VADPPRADVARSSSPSRASTTEPDVTLGDLSPAANDNRTLIDTGASLAASRLAHSPNKNKINH
jgi:hypothetical protein